MRNRKITFFSAILLILLVGQISAQNTTAAFSNENFKEKILLLTDREVYVVQEFVRFNAYNLSNNQLKTVDWSKVLYIELVTCNGKPVFQGKFPFCSHGSEGCFEIPKDIITGNYYIKAYTKWMRNYSNSEYFYMPISIINPFSDQVISEPELYAPNYVLDTLFYQKTSALKCDIQPVKMNEKDVFRMSIVKNSSAQNAETYEVVVDGKKIELSKGDFDRIMGSNANSPKMQKENNQEFTVCINSIANKSSDFMLVPHIMKEQDYFVQDFLPETRGISISGVILNSSNDIPLSFTRVNVTIFDGYTASQSLLTDSIGRFSFTLPELYGQKEIFITVESKTNKSPKIRVDNDFCTRSINLPYLPFSKEVANANAYTSMILNSQIENQYRQSIGFDEAEDSLKNRMIYYNIPTLDVVFDEYVVLPSMDDYFHELLPIVLIREENGRRYMQVWGAFSELAVYPPLILLDHVIISDVNKLMQMSPGKIKNVEVLAYPYVKGNTTYGGVINVFTKEGDLGGFDLPSSGLFFNYTMFNSKNTTYTSDDANQFSNTLYWNVFNPQKSTTFDFEPGYNKGKFQMIIKGISNDGGIYSLTKDFDIK